MQLVEKLWLHVNYLLFDPSQKYRYARILIGCWYGIFLALIFWNYVLDNLGLPEPISDYVYGVLLIALGTNIGILQFLYSSKPQLLQAWDMRFPLQFVAFVCWYVLAFLAKPDAAYSKLLFLA